MTTRQQGITGLLILLIFFIFSHDQAVYSQQRALASKKALSSSHPSLSLRITVIRNLSFGAFSPGEHGGSITVSPDGQRTASGSVVLLQGISPVSPATFEVELPPQAFYHCILQGDENHTSSGGARTGVSLGPIDQGSVFYSERDVPVTRRFNVGGTLHVGGRDVTPAGVHQSMVTITMIGE